MTDIETFRAFCLSFPETEEKMHFDKPSYRVKGKIFATLWLEENIAVVKLTPEEQSVFCEQYPDALSPVQGGWGRQGFTKIALDNIAPADAKALLTISWKMTAPKKMVEKWG